MDEPLSALDKQLRESMQIELRQLHRRLGATIVYVTHDQREALTMSDRVAILKDGMLVQIGKPEQLHDHPVNAFVARFIGEATLLLVTRVDAGTVTLGGKPLRTRRPIPASGDLVLAVQTEKLLIDDGAGRARSATSSIRARAYASSSRCRTGQASACASRATMRRPGAFPRSARRCRLAFTRKIPLSFRQMPRLPAPFPQTRREPDAMAFSDFKVLTFDVVGTLIDFETGILSAVRQIAGKTEHELGDDKIFGPYLRGRAIHQ
jgi:putative spermidine/putrescine transport system ATP-binding protein